MAIMWHAYEDISTITIRSSGQLASDACTVHEFDVDFHYCPLLQKVDYERCEPVTTWFWGAIHVALRPVSRVEMH